MLNKRQLKNKAYRLIRKENVDHQSAYEQLKKLKSNVSKEDLAIVLSKIPSDERNKKTLALRIAFISCLGFVFLIRLLDIAVAWWYAGGYEIFIFVFHGLMLPFLGIFGALTSRIGYYKVVSVFMLLSSIGTVITAFSYALPIVGFFGIPFIAAGVLGFIISNKIKVPYKKKMVPREIKGRKVNVYEYFFNDSSSDLTHKSDDLLDA